MKANTLQAARFDRAALPPVLAAALILAGLSSVSCSSSEDDDETPFLVLSTGHAIVPGSTPVADDDWLAYLLSEANQGGVDLNGNNDPSDGIAVRYDTESGVAEVLNVAATDLCFARRTLFLTVLEADGVEDWNDDGDEEDRVLLYNTPTSGEVVYLDDLAPGTEVVTLGSAVFYATATAPTTELESNLRLVEVPTSGAVPNAPTVVPTGTDPDMNGISFTIEGSSGDIVFLTADETVEGDLNGDTDSDDTSILAVLDAGAATPTAVVTGVAIAPNSTPTAVLTPADEWLVAFLADESQESVSLNDPATLPLGWAPSNCQASDPDELDSVLHWFVFSDLAMNTPPENTGLVGNSDGAAYVLANGFVGVVSFEDDQGPSGCDLNGDSDTDDHVFRWAATSGPLATALPETAPSRLVAVDIDVPGGTGGVIGLDGLWVIQADEADDRREYDTDAAVDRNVILSLDPEAVAPQWNNMHLGNVLGPRSATWMSVAPGTSAEFYIAMAEDTHSVFNGGGDLNGDGDETDAVPGTVRVAQDTTLGFLWRNVAVKDDNPGIIVRNNLLYARLDEADQGGLDVNGNNSFGDLILIRFSVAGPSAPLLMATSTTSNQPAATFAEGAAEFGVTLSDEAIGGAILNDDGDTGDTVVRYFRLP